MQKELKKKGKRFSLAKMGRGSRRKGLQMWMKQPLLLSFQLFLASAMQTVSLVDVCGRTLHGDGMVLTSHGDSRRYYFVATGIDCQVMLQAASPKDRVQFQFRFFLVYSMLRWPSTPLPRPTKEAHHAPAPPQVTLGPCATGSYVQFYNGKDHTAAPVGIPLCGQNIPRPVLSSGQFLTLRLVTRGQQPRVDFVGDFTSLRTDLNASACTTASYFPCRNGHCIPSSLVCDGRQVDNCGDGTDQATQPPARCEGSPTLGSTPHPEAASAVSTGSSPQVTCAGWPETSLAPSGFSTWDPTDTCKPFLASLAALLGAVLLAWCCWSPGWFLWQAGACRHLPGCNSVCAACHLCPRSCARRETRKVAPQVATDPPV